MAKKLRILFLEDDPSAAELQVMLLEQGGYSCEWHCVETERDFSAGLKAGDLDLVLADYSLPTFDGMSALRLFIRSGLAVPFIIVSGMIGEETAVECLKAGATDYVLKVHLDRLVPVVKRALREKEEQRLRREAEEALRQSDARYRRLSDSVNEFVFRYDLIEQRFEYVSARIKGLTGVAVEEAYQDPRNLFRRIHSEDRSRVLSFGRKLLFEGANAVMDFRVIHKSGTMRWMHLNAVPVRDDRDRVVATEGSFRDITEGKRAEIQLRSSRDQLRELTLHLQSVREEERAQIARKVHDELGQALTALKVDLAWLRKHWSEGGATVTEKLQGALELTDSAARTIQSITTELRPGLLDDLGLSAAIEWQVDEFAARTGLRCSCDCRALKTNIDRNLSTALFRICQESLTNVARHASASQVWVCLKEVAGDLLMKIKDDGIGIPPERLANGQSFGLIGMRERVYPWHGQVTFDTRTGGGTTVNVRIPRSQ